MGKKNLMDLFETQEYISNENHQWNVFPEMKDKVASMVQKYNERAIKMGYNDSILNFDVSSLTLRGIFVHKAEKPSWLAKMVEAGRNADLSGDIRNILLLCTKTCPQCHSNIPALSKGCEVCGKQFLQDKAKDEVVETEKEMQSLIKPKDAENEMGVRYELFNVRTEIVLPDGISYYDDILSHFEEFIATQNAKPKNEVRFFMSLDLDKMDLADEEIITEDDQRLGINSFEICNVVFSKYNKWMPLFEDKVNSGKPQIFITIMDWQSDLNDFAKFATENCISYAFEKGLTKYGKEYTKIIFSFDDDAKAATNFLCNVATNILSVPKDVPVAIFISSNQTKTKAQKEYKVNNTFGAKDFAKGTMLLLKDKFKGKNN